MAKKAGLEQTFKISKGLWSRFKSEKTSLMLAEDYAGKNKDQALQSYLGIFRSLAQEFKDRRFVLIFDQFEGTGEASTRFFLNFAKLVTPQERFDIIVSFRTDDRTWNDPTVKTVYKELEQKFTEDLAAKKLPIEGLTAEDIGKWIKQVRDISLPLIPNLQRIRENSAGLPLVLDEWIRTSENLNDYEEIKRDKLCNRTIMLRKGLDEQDQDNLYKMSILLQPLKKKRLAKYLGIDEENTLQIRSLVDRLSEKRIFDEDLKWFRHELVQRCFEDDLDDDDKSSYHERAAKFFESLMGEKNQGKQEDQLKNEQSIDSTSIEKVEDAQDSYATSISYAYHLHMVVKQMHYHIPIITIPMMAALVIIIVKQEKVLQANFPI
jgi:hypothetical protein